MKGWAEKKAVIAATKSLAVKGWLRKYNENGSVPCMVQIGPLTDPLKVSSSKNDNLKDGHVWIHLFRPDGARYSLQVPIESVSVHHTWFKHSIRLNMLPQALEVMRVSSSGKGN